MARVRHEVDPDRGRIMSIDVDVAARSTRSLRRVLSDCHHRIEPTTARNEPSLCPFHSMRSPTVTEPAR
jgi:hypothetical protein